ncbi:hypothetical protein LYZ96_12230 [Xanthomonas hortorum pv. vitians]|uniref:Uncharacterized protein n=1 Tax=Xanthomonas axonopodis pv. vasculorum TaxID=325777 RepID=A0A098PTH5_9XANT|nr:MULTISPECIES: hypothetical protein [Xanthomonas]KGE50379.1 hypothetical protein GW15_0221720 [Xanthomonas axonopodis pv. vasculorum]MCE4289864.1 hypothetical protein [Xanthomonas hortorum pv. vitians]
MMRKTWRLLRLAATRQISWYSFRCGLRSTQIAVALVGGGMVFCDPAVEALFFEVDDSHDA